MQEENLDEEVNEEDLKFRSWDIKQTNEHLYEVINTLDTKEKYNVFLGEFFLAPSKTFLCCYTSI